MRISALGVAAGTNCGRKAKKKIESFGLRMLISTDSTITLPADFGSRSASTLSAPDSLRVAQAM
ncbi:hypothetical protein D3C87_2100230 [compost metagenome]